MNGASTDGIMRYRRTELPVSGRCLSSFCGVLSSCEHVKLEHANTYLNGYSLDFSKIPTRNACCTGIPTYQHASCIIRNTCLRATGVRKLPCLLSSYGVVEQLLTTRYYLVPLTPVMQFEYNSSCCSDVNNLSLRCSPWSQNRRYNLVVIIFGSSYSLIS